MQSFVSRLLLISVAFFLSQEVLAEFSQVKVRPRVMGETMPAMQVLDASGKLVKLHDYTSGRFSLVIFLSDKTVPNPTQKQYFNSLTPFFKKLDYKLILIFPFSSDSSIFKSLSISDGVQYFFDPKKEAYTAMGLADKASEKSPVLTGFFIVGPDEVIRFQNATLGPSTPVSGEILVFAAKQYRDLYKKAEEKANDEKK